MKRLNAEVKVVNRAKVRLTLLSVLTAMVVGLSNATLVAATEVPLWKIESKEKLGHITEAEKTSAIQYLNSTEAAEFSKFANQFASTGEVIKFIEGFKAAALDAKNLDAFKKDVAAKFEKVSDDNFGGFDKATAFRTLIKSLLGKTKDQLKDAGLVAELLDPTKSKGLLTDLGLTAKDPAATVDNQENDEAKRIREELARVKEELDRTRKEMGDDEGLTPYEFQEIVKGYEDSAKQVCRVVDEQARRAQEEKARRDKEFAALEDLAKQLATQINAQPTMPALAKKEQNPLDALIPKLLEDMNPKRPEQPMQQPQAPVAAQRPQRNNNQDKNVLDNPIPQESPQIPQQGQQPELQGLASNNMSQPITVRQLPTLRNEISSVRNQVSANNTLSKVDSLITQAQNPMVMQNPFLAVGLAGQLAAAKTERENKIAESNSKLAAARAQLETVQEQLEMGRANPMTLLSGNVRETERNLLNEVNRTRGYYEDLRGRLSSVKDVASQQALTAAGNQAKTAADNAQRALDMHRQESAGRREEAEAALAALQRQESQAKTTVSELEGSIAKLQGEADKLEAASTNVSSSVLASTGLQGGQQAQPINAQRILGGTPAVGGPRTVNQPSGLRRGLLGGAR